MSNDKGKPAFVSSRPIPATHCIHRRPVNGPCLDCEVGTYRKRKARAAAPA